MIQHDEAAETITVSSIEQTVADLENLNNAHAIRQPEQLGKCFRCIPNNTCTARKNSEQDCQFAKKSQWNGDYPGVLNQSNKTLPQEIPIIRLSEINLVKGFSAFDPLVLVPSTMLRRLTQMKNINETESRTEVVILPNRLEQGQKCT